ncbi:acyl-CoA N-acyltransferase [Xylariaceae sp. FL0594]|nr:acyl-CoA N-acyltransferase [Xylariaceae sp. FL0594]
MNNIYRSERLVYIPIERDPSYDEFFVKLMNDEEVLNYDLSLPTGMSRGNAEAMIGSVGSSHLLAMYICLPPPAKPGHDHECKAHTCEALEWALEWAFKYAHLHRVEAFMGAWSDAKIFYRTLGFHAEGYKRDAVWFKGTWQGMRETAILEDDWRRIRDERLRMAKRRLWKRIKESAGTPSSVELLKP